MNPRLSAKLEELEKAGDYECWYLVKQPTAFDSLCYLVSFLAEYKTKEVSENLQDFIGKKVPELKEAKPNIEISNNYRALRVAAFFGLIAMTSAKYDEAVITDTFNEITSRCDGKYENTELYVDIIQRQIEKMFISSQIDEAYQGARQEYRLYPVMLLYKVLIELGRSSKKYAISMTEYRYLVATTKVFEGFLETLLLIKLLREDKEGATDKFEQYRTKFDNRLILALKQLDTLEIDRDRISLKKEKVEEVARKVFIFEQNPNVFTTDNYLGFLGSVKSLFDLDSFEKESKEDKSNITIEPAQTHEELRVTTGCNVLLYGVPGAGKSWTIEHEYCDNEDCMERLVFHPDYMYSDFVGQILPVVKDEDKVRYEFMPGPFTKLLKRAYCNPEQSFYLIVEEINRGNAPAIFGEIFQLLDRKDENEFDKAGKLLYKKGTSEYGITNANIARIVYGDEEHKVRIPANMSILGTMNTSDQNVFTLDTAFQRRWIMRMIPNSFVVHKFADRPILDTGVSWRQFCETINEEILRRNNITSSEDKRLGAYFISASDLEMKPITGEMSEKEKIQVEHNNGRFAEKVLKYLWDDAFKFSHQDTFNTRQFGSLEKVIEGFMSSAKPKKERFRVFNENLQKMILDGVSSESNEVSENNSEGSQES